jgi:hypothetical protein
LRVSGTKFSMKRAGVIAAATAVGAFSIDGPCRFSTRRDRRCPMT